MNKVIKAAFVVAVAAVIGYNVNDYPHNSPNYKITRKNQSCKGKVLENARHS